jgi:hypothetical protein
VRTVAGSFLDRLGGLFRRPAAPQAAPEAAPAEAPAEAPVEAAPAAEVAYAAPAESAAPAEAASAEQVAAAEPAASAPVVAEAAPPAEPTKSAEELEEERLIGEVDQAWASGDFGRVTELLDRLRELQPEDAGAIDEKIAAAQYNQAAALERGGDLERALFLYQEAQRRNPNLGEAGFAIDRVKTALTPPMAAAASAAEAAPAAAPEAAAEQSYTVVEGDTLSAIAERFYGSANEWPRIFEANRDQLDNPDLIQIGQTLRIPG